MTMPSFTNYAPNNILRIKMVKAMEFIASNINNEDILETWLSLGVADGDISYGDLQVQPTGTLPDEDYENLYPYFEDDENFAQLMDLFLYVMDKARKNGGLYCDHVASKNFFK